MNKDLSFDDVLLNPRFNTIESRADVDLSTSVAGLNLRFGLISSNMDSITESSMAAAMGLYGSAAALHRFTDITKNVEMYYSSLDKIYNSKNYLHSPYNVKPIVSIGVGSNEFERAVCLVETGAECILIDVAHGASLSVVKQYDRLRNHFGDNISIIVGNFANKKSLEEWLSSSSSSRKPDAIKVGIGGGSNCSTRIVTGCGRSTLSSIIDCRDLGIDIISDGGIRNSGDVAKAFAAGAKAVMVGSLLAGTDETPGDIVTKDGESQKNPQWFIPSGVDISSIGKDYINYEMRLKGCTYLPGNEANYKQYRGSASQESYAAQGKTATHRAPEGVTRLVECKGPVRPILENLEAGVRSAFTYLGASNMEEFRNNAEFIEVSNHTTIEGSPHGLKG